MRPSTTLATQRPDLASLVEFDLESSWAGFLAYSVFPFLDVGKQAGTFGKIPDEQLLQYQTARDRAPGTTYNRSTMTFTTDSYATVDRGHEEPIDDTEQEMYADYGDSEQIATSRCIDVVLRTAEIRAAALALGSGVGTSAATAVWSGASGVPITDVATARAAVRAATGILPDSLAVDWLGWTALINNAQIIERIKYSGIDDPKPGNITRQMVAQALDIRNVLVAGDGAMKRAQAGTLSELWDKTQALLFKAPMTNDIKEPCFGRTLRWTADAGDGPQGVVVESYRDEPVRSDIIRVRHHVQEKLMYAALGVRITGIRS